MSNLSRKEKISLEYFVPGEVTFLLEHDAKLNPETLGRGELIDLLSKFGGLPEGVTFGKVRALTFPALKEGGSRPFSLILAPLVTAKADEAISRVIEIVAIVFQRID